MNKKIAVIDYGFGNIKSVLNALNFCGSTADIINLPEELSKYDGAILPGVGAFGPASEFLRNGGFDQAIRSYVKSGKMLYGICLGFQLFFTKGYENGEHNGLNLLEGEVKKFGFEDKTLKVPHMGWNCVRQTQSSDAKKMFNAIEDNENFYFVHSYYAMPSDKNKASSFCNYGIDFCSSIAFENIWGSQFHPEKSGVKGLEILKNFIEADSNGASKF
ncbi:MAG: imidazole glycerol phosphate synthase subunit HisH [Endomicrobium sp.]|jgi:glutamine amidotransferase|nr:imidazole glycerol phosphate synthase subunit HisH [Endomicrobium sp.]